MEKQQAECTDSQSLNRSPAAINGTLHTRVLSLELACRDNPPGRQKKQRWPYFLPLDLFVYYKVLTHPSFTEKNLSEIKEWLEGVSRSMTLADSRQEPE